MMHEAQRAVKGRWRATFLLGEKQRNNCTTEDGQITQGAWTKTRPSLLQKTRKLVCRSQGTVWAALRTVDFFHVSKEYRENIGSTNANGLKSQTLSVFLCRLGPGLSWDSGNLFWRVSSFLPLPTKPCPACFKCYSDLFYAIVQNFLANLLLFMH